MFMPNRTMPPARTECGIADGGARVRNHFKSGVLKRSFAYAMRNQQCRLGNLVISQRLRRADQAVPPVCIDRPAPAADHADIDFGVSSFVFSCSRAAQRRLKAHAAQGRSFGCGAT
jgi:hypothetical protein